MTTLMVNIPDELRELNRWVCADSGSKIPMRVYAGKPASVSKPDTWGTYEQALDCIEKGRYEWAGFVFNNDGLVGIDIDNAFDREGFLKADALEIVQACKSYTEISRSGTGLHIICKGELPFKGRNNGLGFEIYRDARYFLLTGRTFAYTSIVEAQSGIDLMLAKHFVNVTKEKTESDRRNRIWACEWSLLDNGKVQIEPKREEVKPGGRHLAMVSFCGQMHSCFAHPDTIYDCALVANERYMNPPLPTNEIESIVKSVSRYGR